MMWVYGGCGYSDEYGHTDDVDTRKMRLHGINSDTKK